MHSANPFSPEEGSFEGGATHGFSSARFAGSTGAGIFSGSAKKATLPTRAAVFALSGAATAGSCWGAGAVELAWPLTSVKPRKMHWNIGPSGSKRSSRFGVVFLEIATKGAE